MYKDKHGTSSQKRSYNQKSGDCLDGLIKNQCPTAQTGWPRNYCFALGQSHIRPSEVSAKVRNRPADHATRPGEHCPAVGHATNAPRRDAHDHAARPGEQGLAAVQPVPVPRPMHPSESGKIVPRPAEKPSAKSLSARPRRPTVISSGR
ncbi:unnamed protein product [Microthlaspi erraticum]|uniref:Uncharacterized protein n=1 Tax=Microthlaspi erraticum TaxID=1685480 RepID=A0A6D2HV82_9BRAS|nr:unnamed protein product [Microthlaspi erraticum]